MDEQKTQNPYESVSMQVGEDAVPVCPNCFEPCDPLDYYCQNCSSNNPINPMASYMPLESIRFEAGFFGKMWQKIWAPDTQGIDRCINIMLLMLFCPFLLFIGFPVKIYEKMQSRHKLSEEQHVNER